MICVVNTETYNQPQIDVKTRWNSTYSMLIVSRNMKTSMNEFIIKQGRDTALKEDEKDILDNEKQSTFYAKALSEEEWDLLEKLIIILEPIYEATCAISGELYPTISLMMPFFDSVLDALKEHKEFFRDKGKRNEDYDNIADGAEAAFNKLLKYFEISSDLAVLATVLDPRLKMEYYQDSEDSNYGAIAANIVKRLGHSLQSTTKVSSLPMSCTSNKVFLPAYLKDKKKVSSIKTVNEELIQYLRSAIRLVEI
ncbi:ribonuclease H-like domain-containing protein [Globomyces pollinis-pini]|nr:ribonuclease H-like domain-containing protein [Globomyces pollinis-pini]